MLAAPARVRFLSCEPLLGPVYLDEVGIDKDGQDVGAWISRKPGVGVDWVIVGGENAADARPMAPAWARSLRRQCAEFRVPFFFKQWGTWLPAEWFEPEKTFLRTPVSFHKKTGVEMTREGVSLQGSLQHGEQLVYAGKHYDRKELDGRKHEEWPA